MYPASRHFSLFYRLPTLLIFCAILLGTASCTQNAAPTEPEPTLDPLSMYIGTGNKEADKGIYHLTFFPSDGHMEAQQVTGDIIGPSFLHIDDNNKYLYAIHRVEGQQEGGVSAYAISPVDGSLQKVNQQNTQGRGPCYVSVDQTGNYVLVANYGSGSVASFPIQENGGLGIASATVQHEGSSVNPERQKGPHAHYIHQGLGGIIFAADLGTDKVMLYNLNEGSIDAHPAEYLSIEAGRGPRHVDFHPNGKFVYVLNELIGSVTAFAYTSSDNSFQELQTLTTLPEGFDAYNKSADIHVHPNGKFLYASNRGDSNSIAVFSIDQANGKLSLVEIEGEGIDWPRNFAIDPTGNYLIAANRDTNSLTSYHIDPETGALSPTGYKVEIPRPMCVKFVK